MKDSNLEANQLGQLSPSQRDILLRRALTFSILPTLLYLGIIIIWFSVSNPNKTTALLPLVVIISIPSYHAYRHALNLFKDLNEGTVAKDCGILSDNLNVGSGTDFYGRPSVRTTRFIMVDGKRRYEWNNSVEGGFDNGQRGCVYFAAQSKHVLAIECPDWASRKVKYHPTKSR